MFSRFLLPIKILLAISILGCAIKSENPGDPSTKEFMENAIINCLLNSCDREVIITGGSLIPEGASLDLSISLVEAPASSVTYNFSVSNPSLASVAPSSLSFTPANYNVSQTLTIIGASDDADTVNDNIILSILTPTSETISYPLQQKDNDRYLFATSPVYTGAFSIGFADIICQNEAAGISSLPAGTYKTFAVAGTWRRASLPQINWVLKPNMSYIDFPVTAKAFDTDANAQFIFGSQNGITASGGSYWTGLNADWSTGSNCSNWASQSAGVPGNAGNASNSSSSGIFSGATTTCDSPLSLVCVQQ